MTAIAIIDYGVGNLRSVEKAFAATGHAAVVTGDKNELRLAEKLVLPGVGAFASCMHSLANEGLIDLVKEKVDSGTPILGVCVGMQMLFDESDEFGKTAGLGIIRGRVRRFKEQLVVPQVGWNQINQQRSHPLFARISDNSFFYFVHSYFCEPADQETVMGVTDYGISYASVVADRNVCGVQFHPEKSQTVGLKMLSNFAEMSDML